MYLATFLIRAIDRGAGHVAGRASWRGRVIGGWAGTRGAATLAAALALPYETDAGAPLPDRDLVIFLAFAVVLATIIVQGLTLPRLVRALDLLDAGSEEEREELRARLTATKAAMAALDELAQEAWTRDGTSARVRAQYDFRPRRFAVRAGKAEDDGIEDRSIAYQPLMHRLQ